MWVSEGHWGFKWLLEPSGHPVNKHPRQHGAPVALTGFRSLGLSRKCLAVDPGPGGWEGNGSREGETKNNNNQ